MLTYDFENVDIPLYEYIYQCIKNDILQEILRPGEQLPSKRSFARQNGISTITIQNAYDQLISEGYVYTIPKKGYYVAKLDGIRKTPKNGNIRLNIHLPEEKKKYEVDLSNNSINPDNFPFSVWAKISRKIISDQSRELMEISPAGGKAELKKAIARHLQSFRGMLVDPDQIIIGAGTEYLYGLLIQLFGNDKKYCIETPGYKKLVQIYRQYQITCTYAEMDDKGITREALTASGAQIAHICPNHHFPTGITMPASRRYEILSWANEENERYIIEDDYDSEFRTNGKPIPTLFSIDGCEKVVYMNTFSKSLSPTIRISYMVLPVHLANHFYEQLSFYACTVSNFEQLTLAEFMTEGHFEKHINRMRLYYGRQRKKMIDLIQNSKLSRICDIQENDAGLHFLIHLKTDLSDAEVSKRLVNRGIRMRALSEYTLIPEKADEHFFIINYSNGIPKENTDIFDRIYELLEEETEK